MAITRGTSGAHAAVNSGPASPGIPGTIANNDILLMFAGTGGAPTLSATAGWTLKGTLANGTAHETAVWWKRTTGSETAPTITGATQDLVAYIIPYTGVKTSGDPFNIFGTLGTTTGATVTAPSITTTADNSLIGLVGMWTTTGSGNTLFSGYSGTNPTFTEDEQQRISGNTVDISIAVAGGLQTPAGSTGTRTIASSQSDNTSAFLFALIDAAAASGTSYTLTAAQGTFSETGQTTTLKVARKIVANQSSFSILGGTTNLVAHQSASTLTVTQGAVSIAGQTTNLKVARKIVATQATFTIIGQTTNLSYRSANSVLVAGTGVFSIVAAPVFADYTLPGAKGTFTITGQTTNLTYAPHSGGGAMYTLPVTFGTFSVIGQSTNLIFHDKNQALVVVQGSVSITPFTTNLAYAPGGGLADPGNLIYRKVFQVSISGKTKWVDYLPVKFVVVTTSKANRFDTDGALAVKEIVSTTGLVAWVDYWPVATVAGSGVYRYDDTGYLPIVRLV